MFTGKQNVVNSPSTEGGFKAGSLKESQRHLFPVTRADKSHEITRKRRKEKKRTAKVVSIKAL